MRALPAGLTFAVRAEPNSPDGGRGVSKRRRSTCAVPSRCAAQHAAFAGEGPASVDAAKFVLAAPTAAAAARATATTRAFALSRALVAHLCAPHPLARSVQSSAREAGEQRLVLMAVAAFVIRRF